MLLFTCELEVSVWSGTLQKLHHPQVFIQTARWHSTRAERGYFLPQSHGGLDVVERLLGHRDRLN